MLVSPLEKYCLCYNDCFWHQLFFLIKQCEDYVSDVSPTLTLVEDVNDSSDREISGKKFFIDNWMIFLFWNHNCLLFSIRSTLWNAKPNYRYGPIKRKLSSWFTSRGIRNETLKKAGINQRISSLEWNRSPSQDSLKEVDPDSKFYGIFSFNWDHFQDFNILTIKVYMISQLMLPFTNFCC